jgi:hypothetical protein
VLWRRAQAIAVGLHAASAACLQRLHAAAGRRCLHSGAGRLTGRFCVRARPRPADGHLNIVHAEEVVLSRTHVGLVMEFVKGEPS